MPGDLLEKVRGPGFTPGRRDIPSLLELLASAEEDDAARVVRALAQVPAAADRAEALLAQAKPPLRHRLVALLARAKGDEAAGLLERALSDADARTRKAAARGLGRMQDASIRGVVALALTHALEGETRPEVTRAIVEALGKVGGAEQLGALGKLTSGDALSGKKQREAIARIERTHARDTVASRIVDDRPAEQPFELVLRCRAGLEDILANEMKVARADARGRVRVRARSLREVTAARVWSSVALPIYEGRDTGDEGVARAIAACAPRLSALTRGPIRYRIEWIGAGHRRSATRAVAEAVARSAAAMMNDPIASDWEIEIAREDGALRVEAIPKSWDDRRFAYRVADVPASSHPTIAAAIARVAGVREDDLVWDPFVGSGLELIERARLGPYQSLTGTDIDPRALAAAQKNIDAARVGGARLVRGDARTFDPGRVSLVLTNPPMGRRLRTAGSSLDALLGDVLRNVGRALVPGGRLVWVAPRRDRTDRVLEGERFVMESSARIDMGGFEADLQRWRR